MNGGSIYSLSANGGEVKGYMGLGPESGRSQVPDVRWWPVVRCPPDVRWFCSVMGVPDVRKGRSSADFGSGAGAPVVRSGPDVRSFASGVGAPVIQSGPDVRWLELG